MSRKLIQISLSTQVLSFQRGGASASFEVTVDNCSDRFATFQLEVLAPGTEGGPAKPWYRLSPEVSAKKPPGDRTRFVVEIIDTPVQGFSGSMNVTVRVFSMELGEERRVLRLVLGKGAEVPIRIELPVQRFEAHPLEQIAIPVYLENVGQEASAASITLSGVSPEWIVGGPVKQLQLKAGASAELTFVCQVPDATQAISQPYPLTLVVTQRQGPPAQAHAVLEVVPQGVVEFVCPAMQQQYPQKWNWLFWRSPQLTTFPLQFRNDSNVVSRSRVDVEADRQDRCVFQILPHNAAVIPGETTEVQLGVRAKRHWFRSQSLLLQARSQISDHRINVINDSLLLKLKVLPLIHPIAQVILALVILYLSWWASWLNPANTVFGHQGSVNSVQISGNADRAISGSDDQTVREWWVPGFLNPFLNQYQGVDLKSGKSVRVVRFRPVDNNWVAAGLENGEIILQPLTGHQRPIFLSLQKDDRVLDLQFTKDSRMLFSAHGSGLVLQWQVPYLPEPENSFGGEKLLQRRQFDFAVYGLANVGEQTLAVGGRFNRLMLWDWGKNQIKAVNYPRNGGQDDYLTALSSAEFRPELLATADNQGYITLWNLRPCLQGDQPCEVLDEWQDGHGTKPVRSVALSPEGCYLASAGADGRVVLWPLSPEGRRGFHFTRGIELERNNKPFSSVDIKLSGRNVLVATGNEDWRVRMEQTPRLTNALCDISPNSK